MLTEHFRQTRCHQALDAAARGGGGAPPAEDDLPDGSEDVVDGPDVGSAGAGHGPRRPPAAPSQVRRGAPPSEQALGVSVHRLGARVERWTTEYALRTHPQYLQVVRLMLERTGLARLPDWRYIITHHMDVVEKEVERLYLSGAIPSVEVLIPAVVALFRHIEGYLVTLQDGLMVSLL